MKKEESMQISREFPLFKRHAMEVIPLTVAMAMLLIAPASHGKEVENFDSIPNVQKESNELEALECSIAEDPGKAGNKVFKMNWQPHKGTHVGANLMNPRPILFELQGKYKITARVNLEQVGPECKQLALRMVDKTGNETFQVGAALTNPGEPGWQEISWEVDTEHFDFKKNRSWGNKADQVFDMPVRLLGFAIGFKDWKTPGGAILIDDISVVEMKD